jgi:hypothetical protein
VLLPTILQRTLGSSTSAFPAGARSRCFSRNLAAGSATSSLKIAWCPPPASTDSLRVVHVRRAVAQRLPHRLRRRVVDDPHRGQHVVAELGGLFDARKTQYLQRTTAFPMWTPGYARIDAEGQFHMVSPGGGRRVHCCPQRARTPDQCEMFPLQNTRFQGPPKGAMIAFLDPEPAAAVLMGEGHAPVVAVLLASANMCDVVRVRSSSPRPTIARSRDCG